MLKCISCKNIEFSQKNNGWHGGLQLDIFLFKVNNRKLYPLFKNIYKYIDYDIIYPLKKAKFENFNVPIPNKTHELLKIYYDDYLK